MTKEKDSSYYILMGINIGAFIAPTICGVAAKNMVALSFGIGEIGINILNHFLF